MKSFTKGFSVFIVSASKGEKMFQKLKERLAKIIAPSNEHISGIRKDIHRRFQLFNKNRGKDLQVVLEKNFHFLLVAWGISAEKLPDAIRDLRLRLLVFCLPIAMAIILAYQAITGGILFLFAALLCFLVGLVGLLTTSWRLYVLKRRQFLPFRCWLVSFFRQ